MPDFLDAFPGKRGPLSNATLAEGIFLVNKIDPKLAYWQKQQPNIGSMLLNPDALEIDKHERIQILDTLPDLSRKSILELGAGIGRFTSYFASVSKHVIAIDFNQNFIDKNIELNSCFDNIEYQCSNVMALSFSDNLFDFVFVNWLFMYLEDDEVKEMSDRIYRWLRPNGKLFLRESCITDSKGNPPLNHMLLNDDHNHIYSHYRDPQFYLDIFQFQFFLEEKGNISIYEKKYNNPNQIFYLFKK